MKNLKEEKLLKIATSKKIRYMDGVRLNRAIISGIRYLISRQDHLNKINVFPVPDGDTGTNMAFTLTSVLEASIEQIEPSVDIFMKIMNILQNPRGGCVNSLAFMYFWSFRAANLSIYLIP